MFKLKEDINKGEYFSTNNLETIFSFINITKLYLIKKEFISKFHFIILSTLGVLFVTSLIIMIFMDYL